MEITATSTLHESLVENQETGFVPPCCPPDSVPFLPEDPSYMPQGSMVTYDGVNAYQVGTGRKALIFIHDLFGLPSGMNKLLCDKFAEGLPGYTVIAPDFFPHGLLMGDDPLKERGAGVMNKIIWVVCTCKIWGYIQKCSWDNIAGEVFNKTTTYLVGLGVEAIAVQGNCYGAYVVYKACNLATHKHLIRAGLSAHPSLNTLCPRYKDNEMDLVSGVECPQLIVSTYNEPNDWKPGGKVEKALVAKFGDDCEIYAFNTEKHGFFTRGDTKKETTRLAVEDCLYKSIAFIRKHVGVSM
jgi:dienelactone hydrolase